MRNLLEVCCGLDVHKEVLVACILKGGIDEELAAILAQWDGIPITYAGGVGSYDDIMTLKQIGHGRINLTIGSALDLFGGPLHYETVRTLFAGDVE